MWAALAVGPARAQQPQVLHIDASGFPRIGVYLQAGLDGAPPSIETPIYEDGIAQRLIAPPTRPPSQGLVVLLDLRPGFEEWLPRARELLSGIADRLSPRDFVALSDAPSAAAEGLMLRRQRSLLRESAMLSPAGPTPLHDAMAAAWMACHAHLGRTAVLVITSGPDRASLIRETEVRRLLSTAVAPFIVLALGPDMEESALSEMAAASRGTYQAVLRPQDLVLTGLAALEPIYAAPALWYEAANETRNGRWREVGLVAEGPTTAGAGRVGYFAPASVNLCRSVALSALSAGGEPLNLPYTLSTPEDGKLAAAGRTGEHTRLMPGRYTVRLLTHAFGDGAAEIRVQMVGEHQTFLLARMGAVQVRGPEEAEGLVYTVHAEATGEVAAAGIVGGAEAMLHRTGVPLLPGTYTVLVPDVPVGVGSLVDIEIPRVIVEPERVTTVDIAARGALLLALEDYEPGEPYSAPFTVYEHTPGAAVPDDSRTVRRGITNTPIDLPIGMYDVLVQTKPPIRLGPLEIQRGAITREVLPQLGAIELVLADVEGRPARASWFAELGGEFVLSGMTNEVERVVAGAYALTIDTQPRQRRGECVVASGGRYYEDLGRLAGLSVVLRGLSEDSFIRKKFVLLDPNTAQIDRSTGTRDPRSGVRLGTGLSGGFTDVCQFTADTYDLVVWTEPQTVLAGVRLVEGEVRTLDLGQLAAFIVDTAGEAPLRYVVRQAGDGAIVGAHDSDEIVLVRPGAYYLEVAGESQVRLAEHFAVGALGEAGALFVDPGDWLGLEFELCRADTGESLGTHRAASRVELPEGDYHLTATVPGAVFPHRATVQAGALTVVPVLTRSKPAGP